MREMQIRKVHVDALALTGAMVSAGIVMTKFGPHIDTGPDAEGFISITAMAKSVQCLIIYGAIGLVDIFWPKNISINISHTYSDTVVLSHQVTFV